jgi:hypothetical protein
MAHEFIGTITVPLADDPKQMASEVAEIMQAWSKLLAEMPLQVQSAFSINETRVRPGPKPGTPRPSRVRKSANGEVANA